MGIGGCGRHNTIKVFQVKVQEQSTQQLSHGNAYQTNYMYTDHILVTGRAWASTMLVRSMLSFCLYIYMHGIWVCPILWNPLCCTITNEHFSSTTCAPPPSCCQLALKVDFDCIWSSHVLQQMESHLPVPPPRPNSFNGWSNTLHKAVEDVYFCHTMQHTRPCRQWVQALVTHWYGV